jgi:hypothetical protein
MNDEALTPRRILDAIEVLLAQLEASLAPEIMEGDTRTDMLQRQLDVFKDRTSRLKTILRKHQAAERRKRELAKQNRQNTKPPAKKWPSGH